MPPDEQYEHSPMVLFPKPQLSGSFWMPLMQPPEESEPAGNAQFVKSARISGTRLLPGLEQRLPSAETKASL